MKVLINCPICGEEIEIDEGKIYHTCKKCGAELSRCAECGEWYRDDELNIVDNGDCVCDECLDAYYIYCERCGAYEYNDYCERVHTSTRDWEWWCRDCVENYAMKCDNCNNYYSDDSDNIHSTRLGDICEDCLSDYYYCEECGEYYTSDEWDYDEDCCENCATGDIDSYHKNHGYWERYGEIEKVWRGVWRGIGIELEIDRKSKNNETQRELIEKLRDISSDEIYFEKDGSLQNGFEIITQPHTIKAFWEIDWCSILNKCVDYGYTSHDNGNCGLHLHISREFFGSTRYKQENAIAKIITFFNIFWNDCVKVSRRSSEQLRWCCRFDADKQTIKKVAKKEAYIDRYHAVNVGNKNTIEFRIMRGTLNHNTFVACIDFLLTIARNSKEITWKNVENAREWLKGLELNTIEYIKRREAFKGVL